MIEMLLLITIFGGIYYIANRGERNRQQGSSYLGPALLCSLILASIYGLFLVLGLALRNPPPELLAMARESFVDVVDVDSIISRLPMLSLGMWLPSLIGLLLLIPAVRMPVALFTNLDPRNLVHGVALSMTMLIFVNTAVTLGIGLDNYTNIISAQNAATDNNSNSLIITLWIQQLGTALISMIGVGWLVRRDWRATLERLGISSLSLKEVLVGAGVGLALIPFVMLIEYISSEFLQFGIDPDVAALSEELFGPMLSTPWGIITIGLAAALGEETLFRGATQPRFGLIFTALAFAIVHSNYGLSVSTIIVFLIGLLLGLIRNRHSTSMSMVVHAVYNSSLGLITYLGIVGYE